MSVEGTEVTRLGDYELLHELKSGGMGKVYLARKRSTGGFEKLAAIKTILKELSDRTELRTMFFDEAQLLARLEHPAVAQVHDFGEHDQTLFLAMEYVPGVSFAELKSDGTPPGVAMRLIAQVCRALHAAHELRDRDGSPLDVVHRDVSPDNLMLTFDGHVKVLDFGIALMRGRQSPATEFGSIKGKPPYLSPEQVKGQRLDRRTDVWSTGVVLWELLTGENLFNGDSIFEIALAVDDQELLPPSQVAGELPPGLDEIVMRALARPVEERYQSASEMADALEQLALRDSAPSIADFSQVALSARHQDHRDWLRDVLGGQSPAKRVGRETGQRTVPAAVIAEVAPVVEPEPSKVDVPVSAGRAKTPARYALLLMLLAAVAGVSWYAMRPAKHAPSNVATIPIDASSTTNMSEADAGAIVAPPAPVDAAIVNVANGIDGGALRQTERKGTRRANKTPPKKEAPKPEPEAVRVVAPTGNGTLTIAAEPYALVRVNGKDVGATPQLRKTYPAGTYVIELIHPDTGALRLRKTVKLQDGGHKSVIDRP